MNYNLKKNIRETNRVRKLNVCFSFGRWRKIHETTEIKIHETYEIKIFETIEIKIYETIEIKQITLSSYETNIAFHLLLF